MDEAIPGGEPGEPEELSAPDTAAVGDEDTDAKDRDEGTDDEGTDDEGTDDDGPRPLGVGVVPAGHGEVDAQLRRLQDADHLAVSGHLEVYEDVHRGLRTTLTALDQQHDPGS